MNTRRPCRIVLTLTLLCLPAFQPPLLRGAAPASQPADQPLLIEMTVYPAAPPIPAMKYRLMPDSTDLVSGNAALVYLQLIDVAKSVGQGSTEATTKPGPDLGLERADNGYLDLPLGEMQRPEIADYLNRYKYVLRNLQLAAKCQSCEWGMPYRSEGLNVVLSHLNYMRYMAFLPALDARVHVAEGRYDDAVQSLQGGFALARNLNGKSLVEGLVGVGCVTSQLAFGVSELQQAKGGPNLYWALADLPRPYFDLRPMADTERNWLFLTFSQLRDVRTQEMSVGEWEKIMAARSALSVNEPGQTAPPWQSYEKPARQYLLDSGMPAEKVRAMPAHQAVAIYSVDELRRWSDDLFKWYSMPVWEGRAHIQQWSKDLLAAKQHDEGGVFLDYVAAASQANLTFARLDRYIAAHQCVDALRAYAASHGNRFPAVLADLTDTPAPLDPTTGRPFIYRVDGANATLESPAPRGEPAKRGLVMKIHLAQ